MPELQGTFVSRRCSSEWLEINLKCNRAFRVKWHDCDCCILWWTPWADAGTQLWAPPGRCQRTQSIEGASGPHEGGRDQWPAGIFPTWAQLQETNIGVQCPSRNTHGTGWSVGSQIPSITKNGPTKNMSEPHQKSIPKPSSNMCGKGFPTATGNSTQFWHCLPRDGIRLHR